MKKIFFFLLVIFSFLISFQILTQQEYVEKDYFPPERIIDVSGCYIYPYNTDPFIHCVNVDVVCHHKILENPIGEYFGIKVFHPVLNDKTGEYDWVVRIVKSLITDTSGRNWCLSIGVDVKGPRTLEEDIKAGRDVL
jgi:hypothetical protein